MITQPFVQVQIKENIKTLSHCPLWGNSPVTSDFPAQRASDAENVSIWWRHHDMYLYTRQLLCITSVYNPCMIFLDQCSSKEITRNSLYHATKYIELYHVTTWWPGLQPTGVCCKHVKQYINLPVVYLCFYYVMCLSCAASCAACHTPCKWSFKSLKVWYGLHWAHTP